MKTSNFQKQIDILECIMDKVRVDAEYHRYLTRVAFGDFHQTTNCNDIEHRKLLKILNDFFETELSTSAMSDLCNEITKDLDVWICNCEHDEIDDCQCGFVCSDYGYNMFIYNLLKYQETGKERFYKEENIYQDYCSTCVE